MESRRCVLACPMLEQHTHEESVCLDGKHRQATPNGTDRKPQERLAQDPAPRLEVHPQSSLDRNDSCHPCAHFGELHHQGTKSRWCNLILAKAWPSLTTGRLHSSLLPNATPPRPFHSTQAARTGKMPPCLALHAHASKQVAPQRKWHPGISSAQPLIGRREPASACVHTPYGRRTVYRIQSRPGARIVPCCTLPANGMHAQPRRLLPGRMTRSG